MAKRQTLSAGELAQIPPNMLNSLPALQPPAGVQPNFVNPEDRGYISNSVATVLLCLMVSLFANRVYTKLFIIRKMGWDDCKCASEHVEQIETRLTMVQSIVHDWIRRYSMAVSTYVSIDGVTARFDCNVYYRSLE